MPLGLDKATNWFTRPSLQPGDDAASPEGSAGFMHELDPAVDEGAETYGAGGCGTCSFDDNDRISAVCTSTAKTESAITSALSGRPGFE